MRGPNLSAAKVTWVNSRHLLCAKCSSGSREGRERGHRSGTGAAVCVGKEDFASVNVMRRVTAAYKEVFLPSW